MASLVDFAPAKINLSLAALGRRADGYHELDSLVAFAGVGDDLALEPGRPLALSIDGPQASALAAEAAEDNLVLRAARALAERVPGLAAGAFRLTKRLPLASGIGGGSADAAAALRLLARANGLAADDPRLAEAARATGADVPVCLALRVCAMRGAGESLGPALPFPTIPAVLVNPGVPVETRAVFRALGFAPGERRAAAPPPLPPIPESLPQALAALAALANDLEPPARAIAPAIGDALAAVGALPGARVARMSGSGATVFGLFESGEAAREAARRLAAERTDWWVVATTIGPAQPAGPTVRSAPTSAPSTASP